MNDIVISTRGLTRYFGRKCAVNQVDLAVPRGSVFALMGRNGSGKTTIIRMLLGLLAPTRGSAQVLGCDSTQLTALARSRIGYLTESHFVYGGMRVRECAAFQSGCFPRWNQKVFDAVVDYFGLETEAKAGSLSRGERAGLCLAMTLAPEPELLVLDDPALGLDPVARRALVEAMLAVTADKERTILFSSHLLDDVERVADHLAILDRSILRVHCPVDEFRERIARFVLAFEGPPPLAPPIRGLIHSRIAGHELHVTIADPDGQTERELQAAGATTVHRSPLALDQAVIDYLSDRHRRTSLLTTVASVPPEAEREESFVTSTPDRSEP
jgi:ABC-2 type transport system ATP-binding protein